MNMQYGGSHPVEDLMGNIPKIKVCIRKRPMNRKESGKGDIDIVEVRGAQTVVVKEQKYPFIRGPINLGSGRESPF